MANFKKGDTVRQVVAAPVEGVVSRYDVDQETGEVQILVEWLDGEGNTCSRYFKEAELAAV